ncbi:receptor-interacting serine/threonine-protein kinase 3-like isoform X2 [Electrophorus electricus]|nr:receptor-interacting serine/threonine-protein kinase 3-like isoform X2 [Electrophorus electricus]
MELFSCPVPGSINDESLESWQLIGSGGFGHVYRAKHTKWGMDVAIKLLRCNVGSDSSLLQEAELMCHGGNPNVLRILGVYVGCPHGQPCPTQLGLVMEYMERGSVADLQQAVGGPPPWPLAFRIMHQIALGMNFLHQLSPPLLHLDLKPSNVLLDDSLNAKLTDFGLAKLAQSRSNVDREQDEEVGGTTSYMPPEAFQPSSYTPAFSSDVYSYGVLLWSVMSGKPPYYNRLSSLVRFRVTEGDRPDLGSVDSSQAHGLSNLIDLMKLCWHADPTQRPTFMKCVNVTEKVYDFHKRKVHNAVCAILEKLDNSNQNSSSFKSLGITYKTNKAYIKEKSHHSVKTTPTQEKDGIVISQSMETVLSNPTGVRFVEMYEAQLIQRVSLVDPIADDLKPLIGDEKYANIIRSGTSQGKMRVLYSFLSGGAAIKEKFYQSLVKNEPYLVKDLARTSSVS